MNKFYITAAIPYVNGKPHIGHCEEYVQVDAIKRYHQLLGEDAVSLSGGDENALKNVQAAEKAGRPIQEFIDENTESFRQVAIALNAEFDFWQKGSDKKHHYPASQKLWELCAKNGDIYKKSYEGLYCVGCEAFYTPDELNENGECFEHPGKKLDIIKEENYFFRLSAYKEKLKKLISEDTFKIVPQSRKNEALNWLSGEVPDLSVSRSNERAKNWGVPVPGDPTQRIYVWFDALNIYQSGIGFGWNEKEYEKWWPADVHAIGKGISRFHTIYWPAFLLSAGLKLPKTIFVHEYITVNGQKISKSNPETAIDPLPLIKKYGADAIRYYLLAKVSPFLDGNFTEQKLIEAYNADLANGLGNLISRVAKLAEGSEFGDHTKFISEIQTTAGTKTTLYCQALNEFRFDEALRLLWSDIKTTDQYINDQQPWKAEGEKRIQILAVAVDAIRELGIKLRPFLPETAEKIQKQFSGKIKTQPPLFPRIS